LIFTGFSQLLLIRSICFNCINCLFLISVITNMVKLYRRYFTSCLYTTSCHLCIVPPCGGRLEYLHRGPSNRKRRQKPISVPWGITVLPWHQGTWIQRPGPPGGKV
jgi:hypothetical protein